MVKDGISPPLDNESINDFTAPMSNLIVHSNGLAEWQGLTLRCAIGKNGITHDKREGDGATPIGTFPIRQVFFREDRITAPVCVFPTRPLTNTDGWCDDAKLPDYNTLVPLPFQGSHEALWREDHVYDIIVVLGYNDDPVVAGRGSAIFLHIARPEYSGTAGCIVLSEPDLRDFLQNASADTQVCVTK